VRIDSERQLLLVKGSVPGHDGRDVVVRPAVKPAKPPAAQKAESAAQKPGAAKAGARPAAKA